jgi:hypothetical protein
MVRIIVVNRFFLFVIAKRGDFFDRAGYRMGKKRPKSIRRAGVSESTKPGKAGGSGTNSEDSRAQNSEGQHI